MDARKELLVVKRILIFLLISLLVGCDVRLLSDGYKISDSSNDRNSLVNPENRILVLPNVVAAVDDERFIIGLREDVGYGERLAFTEDEPYGYFLYDKEIQELIMGLSEQELGELIEEKGIQLSLD